MSWGSSHPADRILMHLAEIGAGRCTITDETIVAEPDPDMSQVLLGLLVLCEDLTYAGRAEPTRRQGCGESLRNASDCSRIGGRRLRPATSSSRSRRTSCEPPLARWPCSSII